MQAKFDCVTSDVLILLTSFSEKIKDMILGSFRFLFEWCSGQINHVA